jgi:hypothetical protein
MASKKKKDRVKLRLGQILCKSEFPSPLPSPGPSVLGDNFSEVANEIEGSFFFKSPFISSVQQNLDRSFSASLSLWLHLEIDKRNWELTWVWE